MKKLFLLLVIAFTAVIPASAQNDTMTNQTVLDLLKEGFNSQEIIGAIENSSTRTITFSLDYMRQLKAAGADSDLTTYIQKISKTDFGYEGVIWWNTNAEKPQRIYRSMFEKEGSSFNLGTVAAAAIVGVAVGSAISGKSPSSGTGAAMGAGSVILASTGKDLKKLCIMGVTSKNVVTTTQPVFRFYLPKKDPESFQKEADGWWYSIMAEVQSPNEFQLVKMQQKKNRRRFTDEASWGVAGFEGKNAKDRAVVNFNINEINNNTFEITFPEPLEKGEYVFFWKNGLSNDNFKTHVFGFDFSVQ